MEEHKSECFVYCNNVKELIKYIQDKRKINEFDLKFGTDGGGGFLKICLSVLSNRDELNSNSSNKKSRQIYKDGISANKFKDSGVKKLIILGIISGTQENYKNISMLWSSLNLEHLEGTIAADLKLANIMAGIMAHSCNFPCTWCDAPKEDLSKCGNYRTVRSCSENSLAWQKDGNKKTNSKKFKSNAHAPIFSGNSDTEIIEIITPPELHLMIGSLNKIYDHMHSEFPEEAEEWAKSSGADKDFYNGTAAFAGNSCKRLLDNIDFLRANCQLGCLKYVQCLEDLSNVVNSCFSYELDPKFEDYISKFKKSYLDLEISVTPKVHAIFFYVGYFCRKMKKGLGYYSEQPMESVHHDFNNTWMKYKVKATHKSYPMKLLKAVQEYNSRHI